jgi:enolase
LGTIFVFYGASLARYRQGDCELKLARINQIGTVSETLDAIDLARNGYIIISHRSG